MTLENVYQKLDLVGRDCLIRHEDGWQRRVSFPSRVVRLLCDTSKILGTFDAVFVFDGKPLILFYKNIKQRDMHQLHKDIWNFNESPVVIIESVGTVEIYNGFSFIEDLGLLTKIGEQDYLDDLTYFKLVSGEVWNQYKRKTSMEDRVDYHLLKNVSLAQQKLRSECDVDRVTANALLGKIIFLRYLIDRKVRVNFPSKENRLNNKSLCHILKSKRQTWQLFCFLQSKDSGFNGDLFPMTEKQVMGLDDKALKVLISLIEGEDIASGQCSLFDPYDFSILPIEFISNVYESFIGKDNQAKNGAYYTPTFLADYMIKETVGDKLKDGGNYNCKVLDPSCGSGIFLVESLRRIIEKYLDSANCHKQGTKAFKEALCKLVIDNIFGIDKDESAVQVAIFSIYLTLLDYQKPADIEEFKFPNLFGTNLICADVFDEDNPEISALIRSVKDKPFDVIVGNPPWKRGKTGMSIDCAKYIRKMEGGENGWKFSEGEIAQAFLARSLDFSTEGTQCTLIVTSKIIHNIHASSFRVRFLEKVCLNRVFELSPVRMEVFNRFNSKATAPACVLFYSSASGANMENHLVEHIALKPSRFFSLFKAFMLNTRDIQYIKQSLLKENDFLWKVLVYGSWLDFNFIMRLKSAFPTVGEEIGRKKLKIGQGVTVGNNGKMDASDLVGCPFVDTQKGDIRPYVVTSSSKWSATKVSRKRDVQLFVAPVLLLKLGLGTDYRGSSGILYEDAVYTHSVSSVKGSKTDLSFLRSLAGLYNSSVLTYFGMMCFSSPGIDRPRVLEQEFHSLPYCGEGISKNVAQIEERLDVANSKLLSNTDVDKDWFHDIDKAIFLALGCTDSEIALIDYVNDIIVPYYLSVNATEVEPLCECDRMLDEYVNVYIRRFERTMSCNGDKFVVEIHYSKQLIGMVFRIVCGNEFKGEAIRRKHENEQTLLSTIVLLTSGKITERLFVQKDVRGFSSDSFFIFKPNDKRLWHKAVAYVDVEEFADAILSAGKELR